MLRVESPLSVDLEQLVTQVIDVGFTVHKVLGPGFRERIYEAAFRLELESRSIRYESEKRISVKYKAWEIPGQKIDLIVEEAVLVELKAVPRLRPVHREQVRSYLRTTGVRIGLLMNFNQALFKNGVKRVLP
jgi:GxxExxY protein